LRDVNATETPFIDGQILYDLGEPLPDGSTLVINNIDDAGNSSAAIYLYDRDHGTAQYDINSDIFDGLNVSLIDLTRADAVGENILSLSESDFLDLTGEASELFINGDSTDVVQANGAVNTGRTQTVNNETYVEYDFGGGTLYVSDDILFNTPALVV